MSSYIDIEVVIDTQSLLKAYPNPSTNSASPTGIDHTSYSYMVAATAHVISGQASGNLSVKGIVNDTIRWRCLSLSGNSDQSAVVYNITQFGGTQVTGVVNAFVAKPYAPVPILNGESNTVPPTFTTPVENDYYMEATITDHGTEQYMFYFYVTDNDPDTGKPVLKGYFYWDPTITIP